MLAIRGPLAMCLTRQVAEQRTVLVSLSLTGDDQVAGLDARGRQRRSRQAEDQVITRVGIARRAAVGYEGIPEVGGHEPLALDADVLAVGQPRCRDQTRAARGTERVQVAGDLVGGDEVAGEPAERRGGHLYAALYARGGAGQNLDPPAAVDGEHGRPAGRGRGHQQPVIEATAGVERDPVLKPALWQRHELPHGTLPADHRHPIAVGQP